MSVASVVNHGKGRVGTQHHRKFFLSTEWPSVVTDFLTPTPQKDVRTDALKTTASVNGRKE